MPPNPKPSPTPRAGDGPGRRALLIGNAAYADARLARLAVPEQDVRAFDAVLRDPAICGFDAVEVLLDADGERIRRAIERLFRNARRDDLLLLYFSGHGLLDQDGALNLALTNTSIDYPLSSTLDTDFIRKAMNRSASRRQVLILDCCHSGAYASGAKADGSQGIGTTVATKATFDVQGYGRVALLSSTATQLAWEGERIIGDTDRSLFTHHLVEGLQTGAAAPDAAEVRIRDLYDYAHREVLAHQSKQTPQLWLDGPQTGDLIIARNPNPPASTPPDPLRPELRAALEDANHLTRVGAVLGIERLIDRASGEARDGLVAVLEQHRRDERHLDVLEAIDTALGATSASSSPSSQPQPVAEPRAASAPAAATRRAGPGAEPAKAPPEQATAAPGQPIRPPREESPDRDRPNGAGKGTKPGDTSSRRASLLWLLLLPLLAAGLWLAREGFQQTETAPEPFTVFHDRLKDGSEGPAMIALPGDCFEMGSPEKEPDRDGDERQHEVCVDAFAIGQTEVTFAEYDRFIEATFIEATGRNKSADEGWGRGERPVINVTWQDALAYTEWLSEQTGEAYRLPTEAEWEYAARAGTETPFWTGACIHTDQANYNGNHDYNNCGAKTGVYRERTVPVGTLPANPWGLHEVLGNVLEWTGSAYDAGYGGGESRLASKKDANRVVLRGGSWINNPRYLRAAFRDWGQPDYRINDVGFRLARTFSS